MQTPRRAPARKKPRVENFRLGERQYNELVKLLVPFMREAQPTAFAEEAPRRHRLRSKLCSKGWPWEHADQQAAAVVHSALHRVGAKRPSWIEGQQEYCHSGYLRDDFCWGCGNPLPKYKSRFCSPHCTNTVRKMRVKSMYDMIIM